MLGRQKTESYSTRVGLDIGTHSITAVEIVDRGTEIIIRSAGSVTIPRGQNKLGKPDSSSVVQAIKTLWFSAAFQTRKVVVALPDSSVYTKWLHLEASDEETLANTARAAAVRGAPFPATDAIVDFRVMSSRGANSANVHFVMLVAASAPAVEEIINTVEAAGLEPLAVDVGAVAVVRSFEMQKRASGSLWSGQPQAHCQIGANTTVITVMRAGALEFARTVPVGGNDFTACIADHTGMSWADAERIKLTPGSRLTPNGTVVASHDGEEIRVPCDNTAGRLAREMHRSLKFFRSQFAEGSYLGMSGAATLSGGGALLRGIDACLREQGLEVGSVINPFEGFPVAAEGKGVSDVVDSAAQYTKAVGLALADHWSEVGERKAAA